MDQKFDALNLTYSSEIKVIGSLKCAQIYPRKYYADLNEVHFNFGGWGHCALNGVLRGHFLGIKMPSVDAGEMIMPA